MKKYFLLAISFIWIQKSTGQTFSSAYLDSATFFAFTNSAIYLRASQGIIKTDYMLNPIWEKDIPILDSSNLQLAISEDAIYAIKTGDTIVYKIDSSGSIIWAKQFSFMCPCANTNNSSWSIVTDGPRVYILKNSGQMILDSAGNTIQTFCAPDTSKIYWGEAAVASFHGGIWMARKVHYGATDGLDVYKIDTTGQVAPLNQIVDGPSEYIDVRGLFALPDSNYMLVTEEGQNVGYGWVNCTKFNDAAQIIWTKQINSTGISTLCGASSIDLTGNLYCSVVYFLSNVSMCTIVKIDSMGNLVSAKKNNNPSLRPYKFTLPFSYHGLTFQNVSPPWPSQGSLVADSILNASCYGADTLDAISVSNGTGFSISGLPPFLPATSTNSPSVYQPSTAFSTSLNVQPLCSNVHVNNLIKNSFSVYPNPTTSQFTIDRKEYSVNTALEIFNVFGEKVYSAALFQNPEMIPVELYPGIYFVRVSDAGKQLTQKLVVE